MKQALIVRGGWDGHEPELVANLYQEILSANGYRVEVSDTLDAFLDEERLKSFYLILPHWTMGEITEAQCRPVLNAVASGVGLAGCHGGMCDSFRNNVDWQFMTGGQWVAHPGNDGIDYRVNIARSSHPIIDGLEDFDVKSEQYYMHVDPAVRVLATTDFPVADGPHAANGRVSMPVVWTKFWGTGKVFYTALGHHADVLRAPEVRTIIERGFLWASR